MQKKLVALAVAAIISAPAYAETSVNVYGIIDGAVANVSGTGLKGDLIAVSGGLSGSRVGVKATEDLDNGMKAIGVLEYALDTMTDQNTSVTTTAIKARQAMLAVDTGKGTVAGGYLQTAMYDFNVKYDPTFGSLITPVQSMAKGGGFLQEAANRASRAIAYISPDFGGIKFAVNYATGLLNASNLAVASNATTGFKTTALLVSGSYDQGPLSIGAVYGSTANDDSTVATNTDITLGGSYDLGVAKVMATYASSNAGAATKVTNSMYSLSVVAPVSAAGTVAATYAGNKMDAADSSGSGFMLGYLHALSKTTTAYAAYESVSSSTNKNYSVIVNGLTPTAGGSSSLLAVGLRKKF